MNPDEIDRIFKLMNKMFDSNFSGGYIPSNMNTVYNNKTNRIQDDNEIDYQEDKDWIYLAMELHGVAEEDINVDLKPESITIEIIAGEKSFKKEYQLMCKISPKKSKICFNNYVLSFELKKVKEKKKDAKGKSRRN